MKLPFLKLSGNKMESKKEKRKMESKKNRMIENILD
jgi:hypothetical protein